MKDKSTKYSKLAIASFALGSVALASWILQIQFGVSFPVPQGSVPRFVFEHSFYFTVLYLLIAFLPIIVLTMAAATHLYLESGSTMRKNKILAWSGFALAAIPWIIGVILSPMI